MNDHAHHHAAADVTGAADIATDPVCGMQVVIEGAQNTAEHEGTMYYFCGKGCRLDFQDDPGRILDPSYIPSM